MLTDTHCHLDIDRFDGDRDAVVARARDAGVRRILVPGLDIPTSRAAIDLAERYDLVYAAVGVQPNSSGAWEAHTLGELRDLAAHEKVAAIGEIGLDYYWKTEPADHQKMVFGAQLVLAGEMNLPVVVHNRDSSDDVVEMLVDWQLDLARAGSPLADRPGVMHSFSATKSHALNVIDAGFYVGITGPVTFKNAPDLQQLVADLPLEKLLIETDAPYLAPHPFRGQRNEPAMVKLVAQKIGEIKMMDEEEIQRITGENSVRLFNWL